MVRIPLAIASLVLLPLGAAAQTVPEPPGLWRGPMHGATPATLKGAEVIDAARLAELLRQKAVVIDVSNLQRRSEGHATDEAWMQVHGSVPGATWMPGAGSGTLDPKFADAFASRIAAATGGDKNKPIVTFCHPQRWGSWNAAKRLTDLGYRHVYWYPGGSEGWSAKGDTKAIFEDPQWKATGFDADSSVTLEPKAAAGER